MATQRKPDPILLWRKSRASGGTGECIEVAESSSSVLVRDTRDVSGVMLEVSHAQWRRFVSGVRTWAAVSG